MGLFDEVVGAFLKGDAGKYQAILSWVEEQGGIQVLLEKLQSGGLGLRDPLIISPKRNHV